jgi:hypothetical protein
MPLALHLVPDVATRLSLPQSKVYVLARSLGINPPRIDGKLAFSDQNIARMRRELEKRRIGRTKRPTPKAPAALEKPPAVLAAALGPGTVPPPSHEISALTRELKACRELLSTLAARFAPSLREEAGAAGS